MLFKTDFVHMMKPSHSKLGCSDAAFHLRLMSPPAFIPGIAAHGAASVF